MTVATSAQVRTWAHETGTPVSVRGFVGSALMAAYDKAHGDTGASEPSGTGTVLTAPRRAGTAKVTAKAKARKTGTSKTGTSKTGTTVTRRKAKASKTLGRKRFTGTAGAKTATKARVVAVRPDLIVAGTISPAEGSMLEPLFTAGTVASAPTEATQAPMARPTGDWEVPAPDRATAPAKHNGSAASKGDLTGNLRSLLTGVRNQVETVNRLSVRIDELVAALNTARAEQAVELEKFDALRSCDSGDALGAFLDAVVDSVPPKISEVIPPRLINS